MLTDKLAKLSEKTLGNTINMINLGIDLPRTKQDEESASYCSLLKKDTGHIDYFKSSDEIINLIRGLQPWPCAFSIYKDTNFKIYRAIKLDSKSSDKVGLIARCTNDELIITTATKDISLLEIQFSGKKRMNIRDFLRGNKLEEGVVLK